MRRVSPATAELAQHILELLRLSERPTRTRDVYRIIRLGRFYGELGRPSYSRVYWVLRMLTKLGLVEYRSTLEGHGWVVTEEGRERSVFDCLAERAWLTV